VQDHDAQDCHWSFYMPLRTPKDRSLTRGTRGWEKAVLMPRNATSLVYLWLWCQPSNMTKCNWVPNG
jgi:hypothetical protein